MTRLALLVVALLSVAAAIGGTDAEIEAIFNKMLAADGIVLSNADHASRLSRFAKNFREAAEGRKVTLDFMLSAEEKEGRNGGESYYSEPDSDDMELQKREEDLLLEVRAPISYDSRKALDLNDIQNQGLCGNCYVFTLLGALEIAYLKYGGRKIKFSEQELTDCHYKGCHGSALPNVAKNVVTMDKISTKEAYGPYLNTLTKESFTCRANTTQDSLMDIKVKGTIQISSSQLEAAVVKYGSIMTCLRWDDKFPNYPCNFDNYDGGVFDGVAWGSDEMKRIYGSDEPAKCQHAVLIVGYTPSMLIVRNSHGHSFGDNGYFYIKRDNNCAIEDAMWALVVERRSGSKDVAENGCPSDKPNYCEDINTCIPTDETCVTRDMVAKRDVMDEEEGELPGRLARSLHLELNEDSEDLVKRGCSDDSMCSMILGGDLGRTYTCADAIAIQMCRKSCDLCGGATGNCYKPNIANGQVMNRGAMLSSGEELVVRCDRGYVLSGPTATCLIQNIYTNELTDARIMPVCTPVGSETLVGNGEHYTGTKSTAMFNRAATECQIWDKTVFEGEAWMDDLGDPINYALGFHNFCRNPGGTEVVPYCLVSTNLGAAKMWCFDYPGDVCSERCSGEVTNQMDVSNPGVCSARARCEYDNTKKESTVEYYWKYCTATCCARAGC